MNKNAFLALFLAAPLLFLPLASADSAEAGTSYSTSYYSQLTDEEMGVYDAIKATEPDSGNNWTVTLSADPAPSADSVRHAVAALYLDEPGLIWLWKVPNDLENAFAYDGAAKTIVFELLPEVDQTTYADEMIGFVEDLDIEEGTSVSEAIAMIDSKLRNAAEYTNDVDNPLYYTAYGAMIGGKANSFGFAAAVKYCVDNLTTVTYESVIICGTLNDPDGSYAHSWNAVNDSGSWYGVDVGLNEKKNTDAYIMKASNDRGYNTDYIFNASHDPDMSGFIGTNMVINPPELFIRPVEVPQEPTFIEKYGGDIVIISIVAVLCITLAIFARRV